ncbi:MAG: hypothetical protein WCI73_10525, partial [Phycisphaerae bacterium]
MNTVCSTLSTAQRTAAIRCRILEDKATRSAAGTDAQALLVRYRSLKNSAGLPRRVRRGLRTRDCLLALRFVVDDYDL